MHARVVLSVRLTDFRAGEQPTQQRRRALLERVRARVVDPRVERLRGAAYRLEAHRRRRVRRAPQHPGVVHEQRRHPRLRLRPIHERQPLFRLEGDGSQPIRPERGAVRALADHREGQVRERRKIARGADAPLRRNARMHLRIQHLDDQLGQRRSHAARAAHQHIGAQQHHRPHGIHRQRVTHARGVAANQIELQRSRLLGLDPHVGELPEPSVDPVDRVATPGGGLDGAAGCAHRSERMRSDGDGHAMAGDCDDVRDRQGTAVQHDRGGHAERKLQPRDRRRQVVEGVTGKRHEKASRNDAVP